MASQTVVPDDVLKLIELQDFFLGLERPRKNTSAHADALKKVREFGRVIKSVEGKSVYRSHLPGPEIIDACKALHAKILKLLG